MSEIDTKFAALLAGGLKLSAPVGPETVVPDGGRRIRSIPDECHLLQPAEDLPQRMMPGKITDATK